MQERLATAAPPTELPNALPKCIIGMANVTTFSLDAEWDVLKSANGAVMPMGKVSVIQLGYRLSCDQAKALILQVSYPPPTRAYTCPRVHTHLYFPTHPAQPRVSPLHSQVGSLKTLPDRLVALFADPAITFIGRQIRGASPAGASPNTVPSAATAPAATAPAATAPAPAPTAPTTTAPAATAPATTAPAPAPTAPAATRRPPSSTCTVPCLSHGRRWCGLLMACLLWGG